MKESFDLLRNALDLRENLLIQQIEVLSSHPHQKQKQTSSPIGKIEFVRENEENVLKNIRSFGRFSYSMSKNLLVSEDYICPTVDHELMYKYINDNDTHDGGTNSNDEHIFVDFALLRQNRNTARKSIINITLRESRELIEKSKGSVGIDLSTPSSITSEIHESENNGDNQSADVTPENDTKSDSIVSSSMCAEDDVKLASSDEDSCTLPTTEPDTQAPSDDKLSENVNEENCQNHNSQCEFYNRLITEIKNSLIRHTDEFQHKVSGGKAHGKCSTKSSNTMSFNTTFASTTDTTPTNTTSHISPACNKILFKNIKNLRINIPVNNNFPSKGIPAEKRCSRTTESVQPVQIDQWLKQIIAETEIEPMQNFGFLEQNNIN